MIFSWVRAVLGQRGERRTFERGTFRPIKAVRGTSFCTGLIERDFLLIHKMYLWDLSKGLIHLSMGLTQIFQLIYLTYSNDLSKGTYPEGLPFAHDLWLKHREDSYLYFDLAVLHLLFFFFFLYQSLPLLCGQLSGTNLDLLCIQQLDTASFYQNYVQYYFHVKHLEKGLNNGWWNFWCPFFQKKYRFWPISDAALIF